MTKDWTSYILQLFAKLWPIRAVLERKAPYQPLLGEQVAGTRNGKSPAKLAWLKRSYEWRVPIAPFILGCYQSHQQ